MCPAPPTDPATSPHATGSPNTYGDVCDIALGVGVGVFLPARGEAEVAANHLQQPDVGGGVGDATPASGGTVEDGPQQRQCGPFAGEPADELDPASGLTEGSR